MSNRAPDDEPSQAIRAVAKLLSFDCTAAALTLFRL